MALSTALLVTGASLWMPRVAHAQQFVIVYGHVSGPGGLPLAGAGVSATRMPDLSIVNSVTDSRGGFRLSIPGRQREYLIVVSTIGFAPYQHRLTLPPGDSIAEINVVLEPNRPQMLNAVRTQGVPSPPRRMRNAMVSQPGADEFPAWTGVTAGLRPDQMGDLAARFGLVPGMPGGSLLGLDPNQNGVLLEGLAFGGTAIPRGANTVTTIAKSAYDPSLGQYSGALMNIELESASLFKERSADLSIDAPPFQYNDPVAARTGHRFARVSTSAAATGATAGNRVFYNMSAQYSLDVTPVTGLLNGDPSTFYAAGLSPDSAERIVTLARTLGVPIASPDATSHATTQRATLLARFDAPVSLADPGRKRVWSLLLYGNLSDDASPGMAVTGTPSLGNTARSAVLRAQLRHSQYVWVGHGGLNDFRSGITVNLTRSTPFVRTPSARVLVASAFPDNTAALSSVALGGALGSGAQSRSWSWETTNTSQWYVHGPSNRLKLYAEARVEGFESGAPYEDLGEFTYPSISAFAQSQPTSYTRTVGLQSVATHSLYGAVALGDEWTRSRTFAVEGGLRLEGNRFLDAPPRNPLLQSAVGENNSGMPGGVHLSPRLGFSWIVAPHQTFQSGSVAGDLTGNYFQGPRGLLRGGIGEWRGSLPASLAAGPESATGLPGAVRTLTCLGNATPAPNWRAFAERPGTAPSQCTGGTQGAFDDAAPNVELLDPSYGAERRWGLNMAWESQAIGFRYGVDATYALTLGQPGAYDLNFSGLPGFVLSAEGDRPVFVPATSIVPATGAVSLVGGRRDAAFGTINQARSDIRGSTRQITVQLAPVNELNGRSGKDRESVWQHMWQRTYLSLAYTYSDAHIRMNGFEGTTAGDPRTWSVGPNPRVPRHQVVFQLGLPGMKHMAVGVFGTLQSGLPYTPLVSGDINGDGLANDRAYIIDPARERDPGAAAQMTALLADASNATRSCLKSQGGSIAGANSCVGPWTTTLNLRATASYPIHIGNRMAFVSLNFANPLGGLDLLLHGPERLRGWGTNPMPDPILYQVDGFDPVAREFKYQINPRFGSTKTAQSTLRAPFRVTLDVEFLLTKPYTLQLVDRAVALADHLRDDPLAAVDTVRIRFRSTLPDIYDAVLRQADSLLLTPGQVDALRNSDVPYRRAVDSLLTRFAQYIVLQSGDIDVHAVAREEERVIQIGWNLARDQRITLRAILTASQYARLSDWILDVLETDGDVRQRFGSPIF